MYLHFLFFTKGMVNMEETKRRRGRPKLDAHITEEYASSRRQALNKMYMYEGVHLLSVAATEIPDSAILWGDSMAAQTLKSRDGILEQLGRMVMQDRLPHTDCVYLANLAIAAIRAGYTTRKVEIALRKIRMAAKVSMANSEDQQLYCALGNAVDTLRRMGGIV